jgi:hypothetical protein
VDAADESVGAGRDVARRLAVGAAVAVQLPPRAQFLDLVGQLPFEQAVVLF